MISRFIENIVNRFGVWRTVQASLAGCAVILFTVVVFRLFVPIYMERADSQANILSELAVSENIFELLDENKDNKRSYCISARYVQAGNRSSRQTSC